MGGNFGACSVRAVPAGRHARPRRAVRADPGDDAAATTAPLNWDVALDLARKTVAQAPDPSPDARSSRTPVADAVRLADHWLDETTEFPSGVQSTRRVEPRRVGRRHHRRLEGAGRADRRVVGGRPRQRAPRGGAGDGRADPRHARQGRRRDARLPGRLRARRAGRRGAQRLRHRAPARRARARPRSCRPTSRTFAAGLDVSEDDVLLYLALREAAHQRLFAHVPWLREHLIGAVTDYATRHRGQHREHPERDRGADARHRPDQPRVACSELMEGGHVRAGQVARPAGRPRAARGHPRPRRGLGRRGRRPGHRRADAQRRQARRRPSAAAARPAAPPRRPSPRSSGSSCGRAGCATPRRCGARCAPARAPRPATASGCTPTCCRRPPTSTTRSASARTPPRRRRCPRRTSTPRCWRMLDGEGHAADDEPGPTARPTRRVTLHADALATAARLGRADGRPGGAAGPVRRAPRGAPRRLSGGPASPTT